MLNFAFQTLFNSKKFHEEDFLLSRPSFDGAFIVR